MEIRIYLHHGTSDDFYLHPPDYKVRRADYASLFELPIITGHGIAGNIVAVGEAAKKWPAGDKICYFPRFGGTWLIAGEIKK